MVLSVFHVFVALYMSSLEKSLLRSLSHLKNWVICIFIIKILDVGSGARSCCTRTSQVALVIKNWSANTGHERDMGSISGSGRSPGGRHGNLSQ